MPYGVSRRTLIILAGCIWLLAGINILRIGLLTWNGQWSFQFLRICEAIGVFLLFFHFIFRKLFYKHTRRIEQKQDKNCPFSFFDTKSWGLMFFMITFGIVARKFQLLPPTFISVFYVGIASALLVTGILFLRYAWKKRNKGYKKPENSTHNPS